MAVLHLDFPSASMNKQSRIVEERFYAELVYRVPDTASVGIVYMQQIPHIDTTSQPRPMSARMARFKKAGLIGCFNNTGVNSGSCKDIIQDSYNKKSDS